MTLVLTEVFQAGIAMAADSAVVKMQGGRVVESSATGLRKLTRVPSIDAGCSCWGMIGAVTPPPQQFDLWLQGVIDARRYVDLRTFAERVATELNAQYGGVPLAEGCEVGVHIAGYYPWSDGVRRPCFYHVHNGHGQYRIARRLEQSPVGPPTLRVEAHWESGPRELFSAHLDFPAADVPLEQNLAALDHGYITRNGSFLVYALLWQHLERALKEVNATSDIRLPRDRDSIPSRVAFLKVILETMVKLHGCSTQSRIVAGDVHTLGIGPDGLLPL